MPPLRYTVTLDKLVCCDVSTRTLFDTLLLFSHTLYSTARDQLLLPPNERV